MKLLLTAALLFLASGAWAAEAKPAAGPDDVKLVEMFLKTPTQELPPQAVPHFLEIDPETLPKKLRKGYSAKRLELYTLKQIADGKKKGVVRTPDKDCAAPKETESQELTVLHLAGFMDLTEEEEHCLQQKSQCTERDLMCEFTLHVVVTPEDKKNSRRHLLIHPKDPITNYLVVCRPGSQVGGQTNFFGLGGPICSH